jgi:ribosomal protein S18 acetylase RimI-like enzyme
MPPSVSPAAAETIEAETMFDVESRAPDDARTELGITVERLGGGVVLAAANDPSAYWSKALGFGFDEAITSGLLGRIRQAYRATGVTSATLQLAPAVVPADWADIRAEFGLRPDSAWVKLGAEVGTVVGATRDAVPGGGLVVEPVTAADRTDWSAAVVGGFGLPAAGTVDLLAAVVGREGWYPFAVRDEHGATVAGATLRVEGEVGHLFAAATLEGARGRGAQTSLIAARAVAAERAGCRWLVAETAAESPGTHNSSLHNLRRAGFQVLYERDNWRLPVA